mmetsp:Transcript_7309/g.26547  ORF Transcript_7309/g.26547 Transcript_7309/m.26547 type:complete len:457 (-) Transcript_7309:11-1381(-)
MSEDTHGNGHPCKEEEGNEEDAAGEEQETEKDDRPWQQQHWDMTGAERVRQRAEFVKRFGDRETSPVGLIDACEALPPLPSLQVEHHTRLAKSEMLQQLLSSYRLSGGKSTDEQLGVLDAMVALVAEGAELDLRSSAGWTPLHMALLAHHEAAVKELLRRGANANAKGCADIDVFACHYNGSHWNRSGERGPAYPNLQHPQELVDESMTGLDTHDDVTDSPRTKRIGGWLEVCSSGGNGRLKVLRRMCCDASFRYLVDRVTAGWAPPVPPDESRPEPANDGQRLFLEFVDKIYNAAEEQGMEVEYRDAAAVREEEEEEELRADAFPQEALRPRATKYPRDGLLLRGGDAMAAMDHAGIDFTREIGDAAWAVEAEGAKKRRLRKGAPRTQPPQSECHERSAHIDCFYRWDLAAGTLEEMSLMDAMAELVPDLVHLDRTFVAPPVLLELAPFQVDISK